MRRLLALLRDWLAWSVPADVDPTMPSTLAEFRAQRGKEYPQENVEIARRRVEELHTTRSPLNRRSA